MLVFHLEALRCDIIGVQPHPPVSVFVEVHVFMGHNHFWDAWERALEDDLVDTTWVDLVCRPISAVSPFPPCLACTKPRY